MVQKYNKQQIRKTSELRIIRVGWDIFKFFYIVLIVYIHMIFQNIKYGNTGYLCHMIFPNHISL